MNILLLFLLALSARALTTASTGVATTTVSTNECTVVGGSGYSVQGGVTKIAENANLYYVADSKYLCEDLNDARQCKRKSDGSLGIVMTSSTGSTITASTPKCHEKRVKSCPAGCSTCTVLEPCNKACSGKKCDPGYNKDKCYGSKKAQVSKVCQDAYDDYMFEKDKMGVYVTGTKRDNGANIQWHSSEASCWSQCNEDKACKGCGVYDNLWYSWKGTCKTKSTKTSRSSKSTKSSSSYRSSSSSRRSSSSSRRSTSTKRSTKKTSSNGDEIYECNTSNPMIFLVLLLLCCCCCCCCAVGYYCYSQSGGDEDKMAETAGGDAEMAQPPAAATDEGPLPDGWEAKQDDQGNTYYHFIETGQTQWNRPTADL